MSKAPQPALTVRQVAAYLSVNEKTVYRLAQRGELPGFKVAGAWRFQLTDLDQWISSRKQAARASVRDLPKASARRVGGHQGSASRTRARDSG